MFPFAVCEYNPIDWFPPVIEIFPLFRLTVPVELLDIPLSVLLFTKSLLVILKSFKFIVPVDLLYIPSIVLEYVFVSFINSIFTSVTFIVPIILNIAE